MGVYYKAVLVGNYQGQSIVNILYYGTAGGASLPNWTALAAADVASGIVNSVVPFLLPILPVLYTLSLIRVSGINERGVTISDNEVEVPVGETGSAAVDSEGQAQVAIIAFQTTTSAEADRNVKRSYVAIGPLHDAMQNNGGQLVGAGLLALLELSDALEEPIVGDIYSYTPVRVGRTEAPNPVAVGVVSGATVRPYGSFRKSRKVRPSGP